jgi:integrase/recombinase XerC
MDHVEEFIRYLKFEKRYSVHTQKAYEADIIQFKDYIATEYEASVDQASDVVIRSWVISRIENSSSKRSLNRKLSSLRQFYKYLLREGVVDQNPMLRILSMKIDKTVPSFISETEMRFLLEKLEYSNDYEGVRDKAVLQMFYHTGIRLSELIDLKVEDVDFSQKQVKVFGKRSKERIIPLLNEHVADLNNYLKERQALFGSSKGSLFLTISGNVLYPKLVYRFVNSYLSRVTSVNQKSPHVLRHAFATHMLNDGADLNAVKEILGHVSLSSTQIYTHSSVEQLKKVYKQAHPRGDH